MQRSLVALAVAVPAMILAIVLGHSATVVASGDHVEYVVPDGQQGITVTNHGVAGLVDVDACVVAGKQLTFIMDVTVPEGTSHLSVRKNSGTDVSSWFSLGPADLVAPGGQVLVTAQVPSGTEGIDATVRIQEIADGPAPGGHHGVKVRLCVLSSVPTPTNTPVSTPTATNTPVVTPTATNTSVVPTATSTTTSVVGVPVRSATPTATSTTVVATPSATPFIRLLPPSVHIGLPNTGTGSGQQLPLWLLVSIGAIALVASLFLIAASRVKRA